MFRRDVLRAGVGLVGLSILPRPVAAETYEPLGRVSLPGAKEAVLSDDGAAAFVAVTDGYATVDVSDPTAPRVLAERRNLLADREGGPVTGIWDAKVDGDRLLVVGPAHGQDDLTGAFVVDVSDPASPTREAFYETDYAIHNCYLDRRYAYLTDNSPGSISLRVIDLDASPPEAVGRWRLRDHDEAWKTVHPALRTIHDVWVHDDVAYLSHWDAGTWLLDISDPTAPTYLSNVTERSIEELASVENVGREATTPPGNVHFVSVDDSGDLMGVGLESWAVDTDEGLVGGPSGIDLYDVSDPTSPRHLSRIDPPPSPDPTRRGVETTAHNFAFDGEYLYSSWYRGGVKRHDVSDPANPVETAWWRDPDQASFWTAQPSAAGEFFVASDLGTNPYRVSEGAEIFTFPDRAGEQADPPSLTPTPSPTPTRTATPTETPALATQTPTEPSTPAPTEAATESDAPETTAGASSPGFGPVVGALGVGLGAGMSAWLRRREDS